MIRQRNEDGVDVFEAEIDGGQPVNADHVGAEISEQHAAERRRADARHFDDPDAGQRSHGGCSRSNAIGPRSGDQADSSDDKGQ